MSGRAEHKHLRLLQSRAALSPVPTNAPSTHPQAPRDLLRVSSDTMPTGSTGGSTPHNSSLHLHTRRPALLVSASPATRTTPAMTARADRKLQWRSNPPAASSPREKAREGLKPFLRDCRQYPQARS